jgi:hypothetical protein
MRKAAVLALVAAAFAATAAPAGATIVLGRSIADVKLNMSRWEVRGVLGEPGSITRGRNEFGPYRVFHYFRLEVTFQGNQNATAIKTWRKRERTASGIGVGSTKAELRDRVGGLHCDGRVCWQGRLRAGARVTVFRLSTTDRISSVSVAFVID